MKTHVLSDEISLIPPVYRNPDIVPQSSPDLSDTYRFFKIENTIPYYGLFNFSSFFPDYFFYLDNENTEPFNSEPQDALQVYL
jgi:hypothetical protein